MKTIKSIIVAATLTTGFSAFAQTAPTQPSHGVRQERRAEHREARQEHRAEHREARQERRAEHREARQERRENRTAGSTVK